MNWQISDEALSSLGEQIVSLCGDAEAAFSVAFGELNVTCRADMITSVMTTLRDHSELEFQQLMDLCGADYPQRRSRFDVVYHLLSMTKNQRVRVSVQTDEDTPIPSVAEIYPTANWFEREAFDMYGIFFSGHPDLRRLLTDYGFHGHPLRKDFPMTGYVEVRYDDELGRVIYEPVKSVEFRNWDFLSPWEGADYAKPGAGILPGDEKAGAA